jgi:alkanesulfonate monooxygenase SsuD/methylene tetrahydromethanopterin reductase-like flavin-dependent oxidoreductase (luciferase family)
MHQMWALSDERDAMFFRATIEDIVLADQLGFDSVWVAEHHYVRGNAFYSRLPHAELLLARLIPATRQIRLATGIKLLILDEPEYVAEKVRLLSLLSDGRMLLGLGQGSPDEPGVRELSSDQKREIFRARLEQVVGYLDGRQAPGGLAITPDYPAKVSDVVWVGVRDEVSVAQAARLGANFIVGEAELGVRQAAYVANYRDNGGAGEARGARLVCVGHTREQALSDVARPARLLHDVFSKGTYHQEMVKLGLVPAAGEDILGCLEFAVGTASEVAEQLHAYIETTGINALNIMVHAPGVPQESAQRSLRLFMSDVAPELLPALIAHNP